jgi:hypothetical protein
MALTDYENQTLQEAITALQATDGLRQARIHVRFLPATPEPPKADALLTITLNGHKQLFVVEIKTIDRRIAVAQVHAQLQQLIRQSYPDRRPLLVTTFMTDQLAEECRRLDLPYMDTVGNLYLPTENFLLDIRGKARPTHALKDKYRANNPAGLKITFALLCKPELATAQYREIAKYARVALGAVGPVLDDLTARGYLSNTKATGRTLLREEELLRQWVTHYPANLRPTLNPRKYRAERELLMHTDLIPAGAYWSGEYGAEKLLRYLKAEEFLIYATALPPTQLMTKARMRLEPAGNTEILQTFWNPGIAAQPSDVAPPLLVYADLMATAEERNLEAAQRIYERLLKPLVRSS